MKLPNIILIVLDTLRAKNMSLYGLKKQTTPFLERIAENSVVYNNAYSAAPWTLPSHASIFTGLYPSQHNALAMGNYLKEDLLTLAEYLKNKGYSTISFSGRENRFSIISVSCLMFSGFFSLIICKVNLSIEVGSDFVLVK